MKPILYMAPIQGITGAVYRQEYSRFFNGYDYAVTPFIKSRKVSFRHSNMRDILPERNDTSFEIIPQVMSKSSDDFIKLAKAMFDFGYETVNWNLGCPVTMVRNKGRGSGMLERTDEIVRIINSVIPAIPNKVSIKARLGNENNDGLARLLPLINDLPLKEIIIHPRTGKQMYEGAVDLEVFEKCVSLTKHSIVYNGDIDSVEKFRALSKRFPTINRWMIGRGGITNPFLPEEIKGLTNGNDQKRQERFLAFHDAVLKSHQSELSGPAHLMNKMKECWRFWSKAFKGGDELYLTISRTKKVDKYCSCIEKFFSGETHRNPN